MAKKKPQKQKTATQQAFFVGLNNASEVRRSLLEGSKTLIVSLKQFEKIKSIRKQKNDLMAKFNSQVNGVRTTVSRLQKTLPKYTVAQPKVVETESNEEVVTAPRKVAKVTAVTELQKLEEELAAIESKLSSLQ
jgi:hypothetical protein